MNNVQLIGRMTKDIELKTTETANGPFTIGSFDVAVPRQKKGECDFIRCTAFGKTSEIIQKYITKGRRIALTGRLQVDNYEDKDGNKKTATKVIVNSIDFVDSNTEPNKSAGAVEEPEAKPTEVSIEELNAMPDDDLPF